MAVDQFVKSLTDGSVRIADFIYDVVASSKEHSLGMGDFVKSLEEYKQEIVRQKEFLAAGDVLQRNIALRNAGIDIPELLPSHSQAIRDVLPTPTSGGAPPVFEASDLERPPVDRGETPEQFKERYLAAQEAIRQADEEYKRSLLERDMAINQSIGVRDGLIASTQDEAMELKALADAVKSSDKEYQTLLVRKQAITELQATGAPYTEKEIQGLIMAKDCLLYTSPSPRDS